VAEENLSFLGARSFRLTEHRANGSADANLTRTQCSGQSISGISRDGVVGASGCFNASEHFRHRTMPLKLHITQMKVPHPAHG
jgi:hypothetical protein